MIKYQRCFLMLLLLMFIVLLTSAHARTKIMYVDSYHRGYDWSDGITEGIQSVLLDQNVELKIFRMDTKRNTREAFKKIAAAKAKSAIGAFSPDVVIASDDNAAKYLIETYYKNARLPFVFTGVNNDGEAYGFPYRNTTGMVEVAPIRKLIYALKHLNRTEKVALLSSESLTERKIGDLYTKFIDLHFDQIYVKNFAEWKAQYLKIQDKYDIVLLGNNATIPDWNDNEALNLVMYRSKIPSGSTEKWVMPFCVLGYTKVPQELGRWAAKAALEIAHGKSPRSIPITQNKEGSLIINMRLANALNIKIPHSLQKRAVSIIR